MNDEEAQWAKVLEGLRRGDEHAARKFWHEYGPLLHQVAERHLADVLRRRVEAEDVVQSALRTFLRRVQDGHFHIDDRDGLWKLLCAITLNKLRMQARFHLRQKRGMNREVSLAAADDSGPGFEPTDPEPTPAEAVAFADQFRQLLAGLEDEERSLVELKLQEMTNEEAAQRLGCSERTVRRLLQRVKARLVRALGNE